MLPAFEAAWCAARQGDDALVDYDLRVRHAFFAEGHDIGRWDVLRAIAEEAGLDGQRFDRDFAGGEARSAVIEEARFGRERYRGRGTPTLMLADGTKLRHPIAYTTSLVTSPDDEVVPGADCPEHAWADAIIYTIGHSTRSQADFIDLLQRYGIVTLVDVRTIPRSRHNPQFAMEELTAALPKVGIAYVHLSQLGGRRHGLGSTSPNKGWRNAGFRGYADYMLTPEFTVGMDKLHMLTKAGPAAVMCAEAVPWRCHRSLIADALLVRGVETEDIQNLTRTVPHVLTPFAHVEGVQITYPEIRPPVEEETRCVSR